MRTLRISNPPKLSRVNNVVIYSPRDTTCCGAKSGGTCRPVDLAERYQHYDLLAERAHTFTQDYIFGVDLLKSSYLTTFERLFWNLSE